MGSVIDYIECPNCKQEAFNDFYYKTGEEYINCNHCGYHYSVTYERDDNGQLVTKDGSDDLSFGNIKMEVNELKNPYGAYKIKYCDALGYNCSSLETENEYQQLLRYVNDNPDVEFCSLSRFVDGEIKVEILVDNGPDFDSAGFTIEDR